MFGQYLKELVITAKDEIVPEHIMVEIIAALVLFFVPGYFKPGPLPESEKSMRKILLWKFRAKAEWRMGVIVLIAIAFHFGFLAPCLLYLRDQEKLKALMQNVGASTNELVLLQEEITFRKEGFGASKTNDLAGYRDLGAHAFNVGRYPSAVRFFEFSFREQNRNFVDDYNRGLSEPLYFGAILKTKLREGAGNAEKHEALNIFESNLDAMSNRISQAVFDKNPNSAYNFRHVLELNGWGVWKVKFIAPDEEAKFLDALSGAISNLAKQATNP